MAAVTKVATTLRAVFTVTAMKGTHFMSMASSVRVSINRQTLCRLLCALIYTQENNSPSWLNV